MLSSGFVGRQTVGAARLIVLPPVGRTTRVPPLGRETSGRTFVPGSSSVFQTTKISQFLRVPSL